MNTSCILWTGALNERGYGVRKIGHRTALVHRIAYCQAHGLELDAIKDKLVLHSCDVRNCHNPDHLRLGTAQDNTNDMMSRGRHVSLRGAKAGRAKLTEVEVAEIRERYEPGVNSHRSLAKEYGVSKNTITQILSHSTWKVS